MKSKKGFTLVEIIVVIAILVVIAGIFSVNMINTLNKNKNEEKENVITEIKSAADAYVVANPEEVQKLYEGFGYVDIPVGDLRNAGLLSEDLKDVETGERIPDEEIVRVKLETGDFVGIQYPVNPDDKNAKAWSLVAEDLSVDYSAGVTSKQWCENNKNKFTGLNDSAYTSLGNYANVPSKLYLMDNSNEGLMFTGNYFGTEPDLKVTSCNVNPQVAGTYTITYEFTDPDLKTVKTANRTVYVRTSTSDVISFRATINNNRKIIINATNVPITIVETYKDGSTKTFNTTERDIESIKYKIDGFTTNTPGTRTAKITSLKTNSDGSKPAPVDAGYTVTDSLVDQIEPICTPSGASTCYLRCSQSANYVSYNGAVYRIYKKSGTSISLIYNGTEIRNAYGQVGSCTNNSCCNGGRYVYNQLGQASGSGMRYQTMDTVLDNFFYSKNVTGSKLQSQYTPFGSKRIALLSRADYNQISNSNSCPNNYLTGQNFWLIDSAGTSVGAGTYNKGRNAASAYDYYVTAQGYVTTGGAYKGSTYEGDFGTSSVYTDVFAVRPTIQLNNPKITSGNGTSSNPYVIG